MDKTNVKVYFSAAADEFPIDDFTETLGIQPTRTYKKGDAIIRPHNPNVISIGVHHRLHSCWELGTEYEESCDINDQLYKILNYMEDKIGKLTQLKREYDLVYNFIIVIQVENNETPAMYLESKFINFASSIDAEVDFDLYIYS
ncbi:DUF4279 domain-containing protein [Metabacillus fastidiosus]|uniref:DUF4279 domain-containing protein n=1 Tax=Metabacillus fastidiosus TaxID=1458 RepID=UPI003D2E1AD0